MAKSGFVPAWMKIQSSDKTNFDRSNRQSQISSNKSEINSTSTSPTTYGGRQRHHSSEVFDHTTTTIRQQPFSYYRTDGRCRNRSNEQPLSNEFDEQAETNSGGGFFSRRAYSRERSSNSFVKNVSSSSGYDFNNGHDSSSSNHYNGYRSSNNNNNSNNQQRRLHSVSSTTTTTSPSPTTTTYGNGRTTPINSSINHRQNSTGSHSSSVDRTSNSYPNGGGDRERMYGGENFLAINTDTTNTNQTSESPRKSSDNDSNTSDQFPRHQTAGFDRLEQDFPSLKTETSSSSTNNNNQTNEQQQQSSIWKNAAEKLRICHNEHSLSVSPVNAPFKILDRSLSSGAGSSSASNVSGVSRSFVPNRILSRRDRLSSTPNGHLTGNSSSGTITSTSSTANNGGTRPVVLDLQTNCVTQTKNLDKRSDFFNSLKNDSTTTTTTMVETKTTGERSVSGNKRRSSMTNGSGSVSSKSISTNQTVPNPSVNINGVYNTSRGALLLLSVPETAEEKELLIRMGWKDDDDEHSYEITDKDREEFEKQKKLLPKNDTTSAMLMSALHRRTLPSVHPRDLIRMEMNETTSDDDDD